MEVNQLSGNVRPLIKSRWKEQEVVISVIRGLGLSRP